MDRYYEQNVLDVLRYRRESKKAKRWAIAECIAWLVLGFTIFGISLARSDTERVRIRTNPPNFAILSHQGTYVNIMVYVEPDSTNESVMLSWQGSYPAGGGMSYFQLGDNARRVYTRMVRLEATGYLFIRARLVKRDGSEQLFEKTLEVK